MTEPEDHTLRLLREIRKVIRSTDQKVGKLDAKIDTVHGDLKIGIEALTQALAGEMAANRYTAGGVEQRLANVERRLLVLEQGR